jgi:ribosomal protein S18 acetylase RimI-like enzyme
VKVAQDSEEPDGLVVRSVTVDDAEEVARVVNDVILDDRHSLFDTPFSNAAERAYIAGSGTHEREAFRRRGVATRLAQASFARARARGFEKVFTDIRADKVESLAFHLALGFTVVGTARRQARLGGLCVDVVFVERFL